MSAARFEQCLELLDLGVEHGFGTRLGSEGDVPNLITVRQVHGNEVVEVPPLGADTRADGLLTCEPGVAVGVRTADCVPILLVETALPSVLVHPPTRPHFHGFLCLLNAKLPMRKILSSSL